jgi:hypothetical protein
MKHLLFAGLLLAAALVTAAGAPGSPTQASETLQLNAALTPTWQFGDYCEPGTPTGFECVRFVGEANVPGLGRATVTYVKVLGGDPNCPVTQFKTAVIRVAGKGDINLSLPRVVCGPTAPADVGPLDITIAGGTGTYAGASGSVQFKSFVYAGDFGCGPCGKASDTWTGTLTVPGLDFDVTAPRLVGAISKTVRAPRKAARVRVRYALSATDAVDGTVAVACTPRSGSFFKVGRTKVTCSATDSSGNTGRARFTITVRRS